MYLCVTYRDTQEFFQNNNFTDFANNQTAQVCVSVVCVWVCVGVCVCVCILISL